MHDLKFEYIILFSVTTVMPFWTLLLTVATRLARFSLYYTIQQWSQVVIDADKRKLVSRIGTWTQDIIVFYNVLIVNFWTFLFHKSFSASSMEMLCTVMSIVRILVNWDKLWIENMDRINNKAEEWCGRTINRWWDQLFTRSFQSHMSNCLPSRN